jgi:hypothetical protein
MFVPQRLKRDLAHRRDNLIAACDERRFSHIFNSILDAPIASQRLNELIAAGNPLAVGRMGRTEARIVGEWRYRGSRYSRKSLKQSHEYSGIFPVDAATLSRFSEIYWNGIEGLDVLAFWSTEFQAKIVNELKVCPELINRLDLEPFLFGNPWSSQLKGKRVLVVHPFKDSILSQYHFSREKLFVDSNVLPIFELEVIRAPQCLAGKTEGFESWCDAFYWLKAQVECKKFDIAIIGCGAFGLPLATFCKEIGRIGIHMAGATQLLFGIKGKRWLGGTEYQSLFNDHWIRPSGSELFPDVSLVDDACYW